MNANELALYLEDITDSEESPYRQAATVLRQQQAQIETMKNPIMQAISQAFDPVKDLTDEEINTEMLAYLNSKTMNLEDFARAILRKAQEK